MGEPTLWEHYGPVFLSGSLPKGVKVNLTTNGAPQIDRATGVHDDAPRPVAVSCCCSGGYL